MKTYIYTDKGPDTELDKRPEMLVSTYRCLVRRLVFATYQDGQYAFAKWIYAERWLPCVPVKGQMLYFDALQPDSNNLDEIESVEVIRALVECPGGTDFVVTLTNYLVERSEKWIDAKMRVKQFCEATNWNLATCDEYSPQGADGKRLMGHGWKIGKVNGFHPDGKQQGYLCVSPERGAQRMLTPEEWCSRNISRSSRYDLQRIEVLRTKESIDHPHNQITKEEAAELATLVEIYEGGK